MIEPTLFVSDAAVLQGRSYGIRSDHPYLQHFFLAWGEADASYLDTRQGTVASHRANTRRVGERFHSDQSLPSLLHTQSFMAVSDAEASRSISPMELRQHNFDT